MLQYQTLGAGVTHAGHCCCAFAQAAVSVQSDTASVSDVQPRPEQEAYVHAASVFSPSSV